MTRFLLLPFLLLTTLLVAQQNENLSSPWEIGFSYSRDFMQPLHTFGGRGTYGFDYTADKMNTTFGISVTRGLDRNWSLHSGLLYSNRDVTGVYYCQTCDPTGEAHSLPIRYLTIPVMVRYQIPLRLFSIFGETGIATGFLLNGPRQEIPFIGRKPSGTVLVESVSGMGGLIRISNRYTAHFGVQYTQTLFHIHHQYGYQWRFQILGIQTGILVKLGKLAPRKAIE